MSAVTANLTKSLAAETQRCLADGLDTQKADAFLDQLFALAAKLGAVTCTLASGRLLRLQSGETVLQDAEISRAKSKLRMLCARLAVRCAASANREIAPYGDAVEIEFPPAVRLLKVRFENTTAVQAIFLECNCADDIAMG